MMDIRKLVSKVLAIVDIEVGSSVVKLVCRTLMQG